MKYFLRDIYSYQANLAVSSDAAKQHFRWAARIATQQLPYGKWKKIKYHVILKVFFEVTSRWTRELLYISVHTRYQNEDYTLEVTKPLMI
jgi:hypothetical protein